MKSRKEKIRKVEDALKVAHCRDKGPEVRPEWRSNVMRRIRLLDEEKRIPVSSLFFPDQLVWRFAGIACLIAGIFLVYSLFAGSSLESQIAEVFMDDPAGFVLAQSLGL